MNAGKPHSERQHDGRLRQCDDLHRCSGSAAIGPERRLLFSIERRENFEVVRLLQWVSMTASGHHVALLGVELGHRCRRSQYEVLSTRHEALGASLSLLRAPYEALP